MISICGIIFTEKMKIFDFSNSDFWKLLRPPLIQFSKFNNFPWGCWFLGNNISNFVPPFENSTTRIAITYNNKELPKSIIMAFRVCQPGSSYLDIHLDVTFFNKAIYILSLCQTVSQMGRNKPLVNKSIYQITRLYIFTFRYCKNKSLRLSDTVSLMNKNCEIYNGSTKNTFRTALPEKAQNNPHQIAIFNLTHVELKKDFIPV